MLTDSTEISIEKEILRLRQLAGTTSATHAVQCSFECKTGIACDKIVEVATDFNADLIVIGTHGTSGIRSYFMGLEAYRVVKTAFCPVLTVPNNQKWTNFREIIFPVRPIPGAIEKYDLARTISRKKNAHVTVLGLLDRYDELKNEETNRLRNVTIENEHFKAAENLHRDIETLDCAYPDIDVSYERINGNFGPELIKELSTK